MPRPIVRRIAPVFAVVLTASAAAPGLAQAPSGDAMPQAEDSYFTAAQAALAARLAVQPNTNTAKNVILFVGDGMGISTLTAGRIYIGQSRGEDGESFVTAIDALPWSALVKTYAHDAQISDSAPTATAIVSGVKARNDTIGVDQTVAQGDCEASLTHGVRTILEQAEAAGKATGIVSTARLTHATPAATYAKSAQRDWESDADMPDAAIEAGCRDIARQLIEWPWGDGFEVALGGGRENFLSELVTDPEYPDEFGARADGRDLAAEWAGAADNRTYVWNAEQLAAIDLDSSPQILGLFEPSHMKYESERAAEGDEPSLVEMTQTAIAVASQDEDGFVLLIESGRIDHAHHEGRAGQALDEMRQMDEAIRAALDMVDLEETLVIVTADHSHGMVINGYGKRGEPILGLSRDVDDSLNTGIDGLPYTTLTYAAGPGGVEGPRRDVSEDDTEALDYHQPALVPGRSAPHAGEDVAVMAAGPWAHLFGGSVEQNYIYHVMAHALGVGE